MQIKWLATVKSEHPFVEIEFFELNDGEKLNEFEGCEHEIWIEETIMSFFFVKDVH